MRQKFMLVTLIILLNAGMLGIGCTILFGIGAPIGAKARKGVRKDE